MRKRHGLVVTNLLLTFLLGSILSIGLMEPSEGDLTDRSGEHEALLVEDGPFIGEGSGEHLGEVTFTPAFTVNLDQAGPGGGLFYARGKDVSIAFGVGWMSYLVHSERGESETLVRVHFVDSKLCQPSGEEMLGYKSSFFIGNDPDGWVTSANNYGRVTYNDLWNDVDLSFFFKNGRLKYEFTVHPGGDASAISMRYEGAETLYVDQSSGDLVVVTRSGLLRDDAPVGYQ